MVRVGIVGTDIQEFGELRNARATNSQGELFPVVQNEHNVGRDHNTHGFSMWLAGGGFKGGITYGATDDFGHHAVRDVVNHYDDQATLMQRFGLDHRRLVYAHNGQQMTMTDNQPARIVQEILMESVRQDEGMMAAGILSKFAFYCITNEGTGIRGRVQVTKMGESNASKEITPTVNYRARQAFVVTETPIPPPIPG